MSGLAIVERDGGIEFGVKVVPGSSRDRVLGVLGELLKVAVSAPPEGGKANQRLCQVLAGLLQVPPRAVKIAAGAGSPRKRVRVDGMTSALAHARLQSPP